MINNARGSHVSPGIYTKEIDLTYSPKSAGITTLGLAGETLMGPAFQPISISNWNEFNKYFGGTSTKKLTLVDGTKIPKYELPYIAKEYLKESNQLEVTRVLGLSGYDAGPAWLITVEGFAICLIRSKADITPVGGGNICKKNDTADKPSFRVESLEIIGYTGSTYTVNCDTGAIISDNHEDKRRFIIKVTYKDKNIKEYIVSLNREDKEYLPNVLGFSPLTGDADIFIEEFYEDTLLGILNSEIYDKSKYETTFVDFVSKVKDVKFTEADLDKKYLDDDAATYQKVNKEPVIKSKTKKEGAEAQVETEYEYKLIYGGTVTQTNYQIVNGLVYKFIEGKTKWVEIGGENVTVSAEEYKTEFKDYKSCFREGITPWFVSELRGNGYKLENDSIYDVKKLFRIWTISDGNSANELFKISIENILPDQGLFDVVVRSIYDTDAHPTILETFGRCSMDPGSENYIGLRIGTTDGAYELKSEYIMVEVSDNDEIYDSVPCGFIGYPSRDYGTGVLQCELPYNLTKKDNISERKQYFGISDITGFDTDIFKYKGKNSYKNDEHISAGFHLDERVNLENIKIMVDNKDGYEFRGVSSKKTGYLKTAIIFTEETMKETIYEKKEMRKFSVCPYGGFDGWDIYRACRSNSNDYKAEKYNAENYTNSFEYPEGLILPEKRNNSDYYAFLAAYNTFSNPEEVDINLFATPGIDWFNNSLLVKDAINVIEDFETGRGGDSLYVVTTPENISQNSNVDADPIVNELVDRLEETGIDTSYAATYWPWVKCFDPIDKAYINLPVTKDMVRNIAYIDNNKYPWIAPAGTTEKGYVNCIKASYTTRCNEEDVLYEGLINPVKTFARDGIKIWGNKTLYSRESPLNRVNVRRLMNRIKKLITESCRSLIFEPNDMSVRSEFLSIVNPILENIRSNRGITDYKVVVDNSPEALDEHVLPAKIWIKPTPTLEYIDLTFIITPQGGSFTD